MSSSRVHPYLDLYELESLLTSEQKLIVSTLRDFMSRNCEPLIAAAYEEGRFPTELIPELGARGVFGPQLSGFGLPGVDSISYGLIMKELERCDSGFRSFASVQGGLVMYPIHAYGTQAQKEEWLPKLASGAAIGCFGLTESEGGSDPGAMKTQAVDKGDHWQLDGAKMWITNGNLAQIAVVWAKTASGIQGFLVPTSTLGVSVRLMKHKLSLRASVTSELYFDGVKLPKDALLPKAQGLKAALGCLTQARYGIAWGVLGAAEACFAEALAYSSSRILFDKPLSSFQLAQKKLSTMARGITQGQLLALRLGQLKDAGALHFAQVSLAKQANVEMALDTARDARDMLGANGITLEYRSMRHMCNLETVSTYEGTSDIHHLIVGQHLTGHAAFS